MEGGGSAASMEGLRPYEDWLRQYFYPLPVPTKAQGTPAIEGANAPYEDWLANTSIPLSIPDKKRTSYKRGSLTLPEFVPKNKGFPFWRNDFG